MRKMIIIIFYVKTFIFELKSLENNNNKKVILN